MQTRNVRKQTYFIVQQMFQVIEQYETGLQHKKTLFWCDQILLLQPLSQKTLVTKIEALKKLKRYHCALGFCNAFIRNDPRDSVGYYLRSNTYFLMNDDKKALQDAQDCYRRSGDKKLGLLARGFSLLNLEQYEKAAGCFEIVCSMGNPSYEALRGLGKAYAFMDKTIKALECYIQCRRMDPMDMELLYDIADTQFMGGYFEEAKKSCFACLKENPNFAGSYMILGMIALREEKETLALKYFDKTLQLDSKNPYALNEKGFLCHLSGDDNQAKELIDQALLEFPDYADALCNKGIVCCMTDELEEALQDFDKALLIIPGHLGASIGKANVFLQEGKTEEALELYEEVLKIYPSSEEAAHLRETAQKMLGIPLDDADDDRTDYE
jgi:tetratricopeptide (TPR) repeat protein